jgi:hypothetical protein
MCIAGRRRTSDRTLGELEACLCEQRGRGAHEKRPAVHCRPHPALLIDMEGESVGCELARRWQFDGIPRPKAKFGERPAGESLQRALVGGPGTAHIAVFPSRDMTGIAPQLAIAKLPARDHDGSGELLARLAPLDLADATKYQIGCLGPLDSHPQGPFKRDRGVRQR